MAEGDGVAVFVNRPAPATWATYIQEVRGHLPVLATMARKDFQVRYKRATLGVLWALILPLLQAVVFVVLFSRILEVRGFEFGASVVGGVMPWSYFSSCLPTASTAVVDGSGLAERVWFPRSLLVAVPLLSNLLSLAIILVLLVVATPVVGGSFTRWTLLLAPAPMLLMLFTIGLGLCLSALHVYFRDVRFMLQAVMLVWIYATPIAYPKALAGSLGPWLDLNPMTGIISLFQAAVIGRGPELRAVVVSVVATVVLLVIGLEAHRRRDRLFVDQL